MVNDTHTRRRRLIETNAKLPPSATRGGHDVEDVYIYAEF